MAFLSDMRGVGKDSLIYGLSSSLSRLTSLITAPIVTRILMPADYGVVALIQLAMGFFVILAGMNIGSGVTYYYYKEKNKGEGKENIVLTSGLFVTAVFAALVSVTVSFLAEPISRVLELRADGAVSGYDLVTFIRLAAVGLFFSLVITATQTILRLWRKPMTFLKIESLGIVLGISLVLFFVVWMRTGVIGFFLAGVIVPAISMMFGLYAVRHAIQRKVSFAVLGLVFAYCLPQMPGVFVNWSQTQLGRGFVNYFSSLSELGLYSIAFSVASVFVIAVAAFRMAYDPYAMSIMERADAKPTYAKAYSLYIALFGVLAGGISVFSRPILLLLTPEGYHDAYYMVPFFVFAAFYMGANNILGTGIWISKKTSYTSYAQIVAFITLLVSSFVLVPVYHGMGAAISYLLATISQSFAYYAFAQRLWSVPYDYWRTHGMVGALLGWAVIHNYLVQGCDFWTSFGFSALSGFAVLAMVWGIGISRRDRGEAIGMAASWLKNRRALGEG